LFGNVSHSSAPRAAVEPAGIPDEDVIGTHRGTVVRQVGSRAQHDISPDCPSGA
jgi:hypothetical protein